MSKEVQTPNLLNAALFNVKKNLQPVVKGAANPFFRSNYADLNSILQTVEPLLLDNDLILLQHTKTNGQFQIVETTITHVKSGELIGSSMKVPEAITDPQKIGSAITYLRRYTLQSLLGLQTVDDDGNASSSKGKKKVSTKSKAVASNDDF